jgi:hypothetical protein
VDSQKRKLQISNGHYLDFEQLARLIHAMNSAEEGQKITTSFLEKQTGLPFRQVRNRISMGRAVGIIEERALKLSPFGILVYTYDTFFESKGTLEYLHYLAAANYKNLVWYEVFNTLLPDTPPMDHAGWLKYFRSSLAHKYTFYSLNHHLNQEVRFIIEAYTKRGLYKLEILHQTSDGKLYRRRSTNLHPMTISAMLYDHAEKQGAKLLQMNDVITMPGLPGLLFAMDEATLRQLVEDLHQHGWVRYEGTHNLDQIRLKGDFRALDFLTAYYKGADPQPSG